MLRWTVRQCFCKCFKELFHVNFNNLLKNYSVLCSCPLTCVSAGSFSLKPSSASASVSNQMITCRFFSVNLVIRLSSCVDCQLCWADVSVEDGCSWRCVWDWTHFTHKSGAILHVRGLLWNLILCDTSKYSLSLFCFVLLAIGVHGDCLQYLILAYFVEEKTHDGSRGMCIGADVKPCSINQSYQCALDLLYSSALIRSSWVPGCLKITGAEPQAGSVFLFRCDACHVCSICFRVIRQMAPPVFCVRQGRTASRGCRTKLHAVVIRATITVEKSENLKRVADIGTVEELLWEFHEYYQVTLVLPFASFDQCLFSWDSVLLVYSLWCYLVRSQLRNHRCKNGEKIFLKTC